MPLWSLFLYEAKNNAFGTQKNPITFDHPSFLVYVKREYGRKVVVVLHITELRTTTNHIQHANHPKQIVPRE